MKNKLYVIETKNSKKQTCRKNCMFFDDSTGACIAFQHKNYDDPNIAAHCDNFQDIYDEKFEEGEVKPMNVLEQALLDLLTNVQQHANYPYQPTDYDLSKEGFQWYISPDERFGCWIKNDAQVPVLAYSVTGRPLNAIRYRSLFPLHDHACSDNLKNQIVWYIDKTGYGQYSFYLNGEVQQIKNLHF